MKHTQHKATTPEEARAIARDKHPTKKVIIIGSKGEFFVELDEDCPMIRSWEWIIYEGIGAKA